MHPSWPGVDLDDETFRAWQAERQPSPEHLGDLYLACACAHRVDGALAAFERSFLALVDGFLARQHLPSGALDDLKQQLLERLFVAGRIREYSGQGSLGSWLRVVAVRAAIDGSRRKSEILLDDSSSGGAAARLAAPGEPELDYLKGAYREAVAQAFRRALSELPDEQRNLLHLHFIDGLTLEGLAALFHVSRSTVARRIAAARDAVLDEARRRFSESTAVAPEEVDSLFDLVKSRLDLTLSSFLGQAQAP